MGQPAKLIHVLITAIGLLITMAATIYGKGTEDARRQSRIEVLEKQFQEYKDDRKAQDDKFNQQLQKMDDKVNQILIILQNKEDRK